MNVNDIKLKCMDFFYGYIDSDIHCKRFIDYEVSACQLFVYDYPRLDDLEKIIWCFTIVVRFARCGMRLTSDAALETETLKNIKLFEDIGIDKYDLSPKDRLQIEEDYQEVVQYIQWLNEKRAACSSQK